MWIKRPRTQNLVTYLLITVLLIFITVAFFSFYLNNKKKSTFLQSSIQQVENSVKIAISFESNRLKQVTFDYTFWDEMVSFIHKPDSVWSKDNIDPIITTFHTDILCVLDTNFNKIYSVYREEYPFLENLKLTDITLKQLMNNRFVDFHYPYKNGIVEIHGATIHSTYDQTRVGKPHGILILGKVVDSTYLKSVSLVTGTQIWMDSTPVNSAFLDSKQGVSFSIPLKGQNDDIIGYYNVQKVYDFFKQYSNFSLQLISILILASISIVFVLIIVFSYWVNRPLKIVEQILFSNDASKIDKLSDYGSEFVEIGNLMNHVISQKKNLEILKEKAEESDRLKSAFLANMSHEIRTPLNAISGFAELLCQNAPDDNESKGYKKIIMNSSGDLLHLINDILDYSKIEAGQLVVNREVFLLNELLNELEALYTKKTESKAVKIKFIQTEKLVNISSDKHRLRQVLVNLIDNALKFTEKGFVEVSYDLQDYHCTIRVKDTGIGIPEESQNLIFERFQQVNKNPTRIYGGTGLGLSICKGLISLLGGKIWYQPNNDGGSVFLISLPYASSSEPADKVDVESAIIMPNWKGKRIVVVEDDTLSIKLITQYLKKSGIELISFNDAESAISYVKKNSVDLILMDIRIYGNMDGFEATKSIKKIKPNIPIVAQTAFAMDLDKDRAIESGCNDYISKPYNSETLIRVVVKYLK